MNLKYLIGVIVIIVLGCNSQTEVTDQNISSGNDVSHTDERKDTGTLYRQLLTCDCLLFNKGFNEIDTSIMTQLIADDFEFYHDEHGVTESKEVFIAGVQSLKDLPFKTWRVLLDGSMEVYPMYTNDKRDLYGAVQHGVHVFYQQKTGEKANISSTARFTHLWLWDNGQWKLKRVLSYDHH
jgi:hypothetical protein